MIGGLVDGFLNLIVWALERSFNIAQRIIVPILSQRWLWGGVGLTCASAWTGVLTFLVFWAAYFLMIPAAYYMPLHFEYDFQGANVASGS